MPAEQTCPHCGTALAADALEGLCPTCVGRAAFADAAGVPGADGEAGAVREPSLTPEIEAELARLKPEEAGEQIGPYKLMEHIGQGGFGTVWVADQAQPVRRRVALKIIKLGMDTREVIARFEQERQALAVMDHPHIAKVFDAGATQWGRPYFVMELVRGIKITDYCDQANLPTTGRLALFIQVCNAVQHAHQKGIIHRDLKPSNILVTLHDGVPVPKVIDFGVAKATQQQRLTDLTIYTQFQQMIGTPLYMSPEQAEMSGLDIDTRSDIYSLGVLLYELLVGRTPFDPETLMRAGLDEMRRVIREQEPPKPSTALQTMAAEIRTTVAQRRQADGAKMARMLRGDLDWIVMKALEKDRTRRYETATNFAEDIRRYLANEPVTAAAPSMMYLFRKFARRHKAALGTAALIIGVLVAATAVSVWQANVAIVAKTEATQKAQAERVAREEAETISKFLVSVFRSPDPSRDGRTITVAETLDAAVKKLETDLSRQPAQQVKIQEALGNTYRALGLSRQAIPLQEKARDYHVSVAGLKSPDTIDAMENLAISYYEAGRREEALALGEEVLSLRRQVLGPKDPETLSAMINLAETYFDINRRDEAIQLQEEVLKLSRAVNGSEDRDTLRAMTGLAISYHESGRREEALKLFGEAHELRRKTLGPEHPETLAAMTNLGMSYFDINRRDEALKLREKLLPLYRKVFGPEHRDTLSAMNNLALSLYDAGRMDETVKLQEEALALMHKMNGSEHPDTLVAVNNLARSYYAVGRHDEALKLREELLPLYRKVNGPEHPQTIVVLYNLATSYAAVGRRDEVLSRLTEVLELRRKVNGAEDPETLAAMTLLANAFAAYGHPDEARKLRDELEALQRK